MKLNYQEKKVLKALLKRELELLKENQKFFVINSKEYKNFDAKKTILNQLVIKLDNTSIPGASSKQIDALNKTAKIRQNKSKNKVQNAINLLLLYNKKISINSVSIEAKISYNTAKKFKSSIIAAEQNRNKSE